MGSLCSAQNINLEDAKVLAASRACQDFNSKKTLDQFLDFKDELSISCVEGDWLHYYTEVSYRISPNNLQHIVDTPIILQPLKFYSPDESGYGEFIMYHRHLTKDLSQQMLDMKAEMKVINPETGHAWPKGLYAHGRYSFNNTEIVLGARDPITELEGLLYGHVCKILRDYTDVMVCKPPKTYGHAQFCNILIRDGD